MMEFTYEGIVRQGFGFYNPNHAAALICALLPFCWSALQRWKHFCCRIVFGGGGILLIVALAMTFSRSGLLIFFAELVLFSLFAKGKNRKVLLGVAIGALLLFLVVGVGKRFVIDRAVTNRFDIWLAGVSLFAANPWLGVGYGNSGMLATAFLLRDGIICRTLVNSHLTLLVEYGLLPGLLWIGAIAYALISGWHRRAAWISFAGMCMAASWASIFDWEILFDFHQFGGLSLTNFLLSWLLFLLFLGIEGWLCFGKFHWKKLIIAGGIAVVFCLGLLSFSTKDAPQVYGKAVIQMGTGKTLVLLPPEMPLKNVVNFLKQHGYDDYQIPLSAQSQLSPQRNEIVFFSFAAEYSELYTAKMLTFVSPPEYFTLPPRTHKLYLKHFEREFTLESQAEEQNIPIIRY